METNPATMDSAPELLPNCSLLYACIAHTYICWWIFSFDTGSIGALASVPQFAQRFGTLKPI